MCGRFSLVSSKEEIEKTFNVSLAGINYQSRLNIAPYQGILAIILNERSIPTIAYMYWGFVPEWVKDFKTANKPINARAETLQTNGYFRQAFKTGRCLIPASSFYEWEKTPNGKVPYQYFRPGHGLFAFAGLWSDWHDNEGNQLHTCTIITTKANEKVSWLHDRMPVILDEQDWQPWLQGDLKSFNLLDNEMLEFEKVSPALNNPRYEPNYAKPQFMISRSIAAA